jgi:acetoin utilization deacetylase AcuC-like enzyme
MVAAQVVYSIVPSPGHNLASHPENVSRFRDFEALLASPPAGPLRRLEASPAVEQQIMAIHPRVYLRALRDACSQGPGYIDPAPTYVTPESYEAALLAAGGAVAVVEAVADARAASGIALVRPPGHHATPTEAMGFCLINNLAVAARRAQALGLRRIAIVDFDVHHGNGTQAAFEDDPDVLYISTHQSGIYPGTGTIGDTGRGAGEGTVINIPLPPRAGDQAFERVAQQVIGPAVRRFGPAMLLVSAGFDAHWRDPLAELQLSCSGYHALSQSLVALADETCRGKIAFILEGGYDAGTLTAGVRSVLCALGHAPSPEDPFGPARFLEPDIAPILDRVAATHHLED